FALADGVAVGNAVCDATVALAIVGLGVGTGVATAVGGAAVSGGAVGGVVSRGAGGAVGAGVGGTVGAGVGGDVGTGVGGDVGTGVGGGVAAACTKRRTARAILADTIPAMPVASPPFAALRDEAARFGLTLTTEQLAVCERFAEILTLRNTTVNLTAITTPADIAHKHFLDS